MASQWEVSSLTGLHPLKRRKISNMAQNPREIGWADSSDSDTDVDMEEAMDPSDQPYPLPPPPPSRARAARGPILRIPQPHIDDNRTFWSHCLIATLVDQRKFSVVRMQCIIDHFWQLQGPVRVVGRDQNNFVLYFENLDDMYFMANNGTWSVHGWLLAVFPWEHNMVLNRLVVTEMIGEVRGIDWSEDLLKTFGLCVSEFAFLLTNLFLWGSCWPMTKGNLCGSNADMNESSNFVDIVGVWGIDILIVDGLDRRFLNQAYRRSTFVATFHTPLGVVYRPRNPDPMQFEVQPDEDVTPPPNDTLQTPPANPSDEDIDPLAEEWFNNIEIDDELLPALGMELIESDNDDLITTSTENTDNLQLMTPLPEVDGQMDNLNPELDMLMAKYCSQPSPIPHPSPGIRLSDDIQEAQHVNLSPSQSQHLREESHWQDIFEVHDFLQHPLLRQSAIPKEVGESSSARQNHPVHNQHFDTEEMTTGTIMPSGPSDNPTIGLNNIGTLLEVVSPYDDFTAASILSPILEESPRHTEWGHDEDVTDASASSTRLKPPLEPGEFNVIPQVLHNVSVAETDIAGQIAEGDTIAPELLSLPLSPIGLNLHPENQAELTQHETITTSSQHKKRVLTTKELTKMIFKRAKLAPLAVSVNMTKSMYLVKNKGKCKHRTEPEDAEDGVADLKRARKGLTTEVQEVFKRLVDEMVAMVNCCKLGLKEVVPNQPPSDI
ncbi:reverse transcriptase [Senna tora]|uniref:Reverse transcriptase n=1 Tax=Senna tora TaxID=362788 RepID=A0A834SFS0_9FABA|nr:reverse transcriptase [Senna tora]